MVKGFTEHEKTTIRQQLINVGKQLFSEFGVKKTSITQLTSAVGIAQGSFYQFFDSKEVLFFDILEIEEANIKQKILNKVDNQNMTRQAFKEMLLYGIELIDQNPFIKRIFQGESIEHLVRKLPPERLQQHAEQDEWVLSPLINKWQENNCMVNRSTPTITAALRGFYTILLHKKEIGEDVYQDAVDLLAECLAAGLIQEANEDDQC
ncbi:TetR family transcriptional regulator [Gracilibacillus salitolerans]|uniref:TetR family transcriptional regulator n=1 Tax=Gracilibacillus salitolerans TaxID=2663022 RepID=A0A5Q2TJV5_9BACI|nr:TetR/AcrR family transcriptional regulator [Gracilibacillus salitolerans]QGH35006.1 TetR family transcriptional regulator [Gracilibacillus salitolerans]